MHFAITVLVTAVLLGLGQKFLMGNRARLSGYPFRNQLIMIGLSLRD